MLKKSSAQQSSLLTVKDFLPLRKEMIDRGKSLVFTNGCFDILHRGHIEYLASASKLGDYLLIGLNSDSSVRRLKGNARPLNSEKDRAAILLALRFIDYVIIFEEDTPLTLIKAIRPNVLVKGGDWTVDNIVGADFVLSYGGTVLSLPYLEGYSTSAFIERITKLYKENK